jgi:hypothetical protein
MVIDEEELGPTADVAEERKSVPIAAIHRWTYRMRRKPKASTDAPDLLGTSISVGDPIVVSLESPRVLAVARGFVHSVSLYHVEIGLDRRISDLPQLERNPKDLPVFRIDKDELSAGMGRIRDNLLQLFYADADEWRRKLIVGLEAPRFDPELAQDAHRVTPSHLNEDQRNAIERVLSAQDYALILGMPGTGETTPTGGQVCVAHQLHTLGGRQHSAQACGRQHPQHPAVGQFRQGESLVTELTARIGFDSSLLADLAFAAPILALAERLRHVAVGHRSPFDEAADRRDDMLGYQRVGPEVRERHAS